VLPLANVIPSDEGNIRVGHFANAGAGLSRIVTTAQNTATIRSPTNDLCTLFTILVLLSISSFVPFVGTAQPLGHKLAAAPGNAREASFRA
jgi:hypothetical protein